ncbi:Bax inhibitor-1 family protein [Myxococcota bacterium]|nr:Bax inhibitor-1 family protein [Myxococcota bacterium]MBU1379390.1 Bax inhibitor-1 family protein [Myxococcota bacterium]MBU1496792.1 Bax inhibitor-1 family protein [Myxococcota bacterium]
MAYAKFEKISNNVAMAGGEVKASFIASVYKLLMANIMAAIVFGFIAFYTFPISRGLFYGLSFGALGVLLLAPFIAKTKGANLVMFFIYALLEGGMLGIAAKIYVAAGLGIIFLQAAILTTLVFGGLTAFAHISKKDFSFLGSFLFVAVLLLLGAGIMAIFFRSHMFHLIVASAGVAIFSMFILFDTSRIIHRAQEGEEVFAAWMLFIDVIALFWYILWLLSLLSGGDN